MKSATAKPKGCQQRLRYTFNFVKQSKIQFSNHLPQFAPPSHTKLNCDLKVYTRYLFQLSKSVYISTPIIAFFLETKK